jgi:hypothetical protein
MRVAAAEAAGRGPAVPAQGGRRRVSLVGVPQRPDHAVDLRRSQRVSASTASYPDTQKAKTKSPFLSTLLFFFQHCVTGANYPHVQKHGLCFLLPFICCYFAFFLLRILSYLQVLAC